MRVKDRQIIILYDKNAMVLSMPQNEKGNAMNKESENEDMREEYDMDPVLASISPTRDMIDRPGEFKMQRTSYGASV
jgi:hypothetical protein